MKFNDGLEKTEEPGYLPFYLATVSIWMGNKSITWHRAGKITSSHRPLTLK